MRHGSDTVASREDSPCHPTSKPPAAASSCNSWPQARCSRRPTSRPSPTMPPGYRLPDPMLWAPRNLDKLISSPKEAINVFDFEPVMAKNVPPAHFGYMASGIDDEVTLRANREGFQKFVLRPRRLVDVSKVDMSVELFGIKYDSPIVHLPDRRPQGLSRRGRDRRRARRQGRQPPEILSTQSTTSVEDVTKARGAPIWYQLYATNKFEVADAPRQARRARRLRRGRGDGRPQRRAQPGDARSACVPATRATARDCHDRSSISSSNNRKPAYDGRRRVGPDQHPVLGHELGLHQAAARPDQDEDGAQGHPHLGGRQARRRERHRRHHRVQPRRTQRGRRPPRPSRRCRRSSRWRARCRC